MHKWFAATACPGPYLESKFPYIADEVNKRLGSKAKPVAKGIALEIAPPLIKKGNSGKWVCIAQAALNSLGYKCGNVDADFGGKTDAAVRAFQTAEKLAVDGKIGEATWKALMK